MSSNSPAPAGAPTRITVVTPSRRAISAEPSSRGSARRAVHTPLNNPTSRDLLRSVRYGQSASGRKPNANALTPHARAARRALDLRRATISTPGRNRRRSVRGQRETPRDVLRALGQMLAPKSRPIPSSSSSGDEPPSAHTILDEWEEEDDDDELPIDAPRLSLPLDIDEESDLLPPRSSGLEEENYTMQSVEFPRRATSEQPHSRLSRGSFGTVDMTEFETMGLEVGGVDNRGNLPVVTFEDWGLGPPMDDAMYERIDETDERRHTLGLNRESGFGFDVNPDINESTFMMNLPAAQDDTNPPAVAYEDDDHDDGNEPFLQDFEHGEPQVYDEDLGGPEDYDEQRGPEDSEDVATPAEDVADEMAETPHTRRVKKRKRGPQLSRFGIQYPPLPPAVVKRLAQKFAQSSGVANTRITPDTLDALCQASDWFFEQLGDSLGAYASHAGRKTIDESDVITLMQRQRQIGPSTTTFSLAQQHLPRELLQHIRMQVPVPVKKRRKGAGLGENG